MTVPSINPGDVLEITTDTGPLFVQLTHRHRASSEVVRVLAGGNGDDLDGLAARASVLVAMTPLVSAIESGRLNARQLGSAMIPESARAFPKFRMAIRDKKDGVRGEVAYWWFWDGDSLSYSEDPPDDIDQVPMREVLSIDEFLRRAADASRKT